MRTGQSFGPDSDGDVARPFLAMKQVRCKVADNIREGFEGLGLDMQTWNVAGFHVPYASISVPFGENNTRA